MSIDARARSMSERQRVVGDWRLTHRYGGVVHARARWWRQGGRRMPSSRQSHVWQPGQSPTKPDGPLDAGLAKAGSMLASWAAKLRPDHSPRALLVPTSGAAQCRAAAFSPLAHAATAAHHRDPPYTASTSVPGQHASCPCLVSAAPRLDRQPRRGSCCLVEQGEAHVLQAARSSTARRTSQQWRPMLAALGGV
jgi:hypothetical protein